MPVADIAVGLALNMCEWNMVNKLSLLFLKTVTRFLEFYFPKTKYHRTVFKKYILKILKYNNCNAVLPYIGCYIAQH